MALTHSLACERGVRLVLPNAAIHLIRQHVPSATLVELDAPHFLLQCVPRRPPPSSVVSCVTPVHARKDAPKPTL